jgi:hypothetical protein
MAACCGRPDGCVWGFGVVVSTCMLEKAQLRVETHMERSDGCRRPVFVGVIEGVRGRGGSCWCWRTIWVPFLHVAHSAGTVPGWGKRAN